MKGAHKFTLLLLCVVSGMVWSVNGAACRSYNVSGGVCSNYITYDVFLDTNSSFDEIESNLAFLRPLIGVGSPFPQDCTDAYAEWACGLAYPKCIPGAGDPEPIFPCKGACQNVATKCAGLSQYYTPEVVSQFSAISLPTKTPVPTNSSCEGSIRRSANFTLSSSGQLDSLYAKSISCLNPAIVANQRPNCFAPLIVDEVWVGNNSRVSDPEYCLSGCCIPCPQTYSLYKPNRLKHGFFITQVVRAISSIASLIMLLSYLVLPGKRSHPSVLILFTSLAIFLYSSNVFFSIGNPLKVQCANKVTPSTQDNNPLCGIQGALLVFSSHATTIWVAAIIINLHLHTVWNSNFLATKYIYIHAICWGVPLILTILSVVRHVIKYEIAGLCLIGVEDASSYLFYPMAFWIVPSFFIHVATFLHIAKVSVQAESDKSESTNSFIEFVSHRNHVLQAVRIQWRALLLAIVLLITVMCYWLFYFIELKRFEPSTGNSNFSEWTRCITLGQGQDKCAQYAEQHVPSFGLLISAEMSVSCLGIHLIVIFSNWSLWSEWGDWFSSKFQSRRKLEVPDQFFAM